MTGRSLTCGTNNSSVALIAGAQHVSGTSGKCHRQFRITPLLPPPLVRRGTFSWEGGAVLPYLAPALSELAAGLGSKDVLSDGDHVRLHTAVASGQLPGRHSCNRKLSELKVR